MNSTSIPSESAAGQHSDLLPNREIELSFPWRPPPEQTLADVGGFDDLKEDLRRRVVRPLGPKRDAYERFGVSVPNLLFAGPPGTGKSYTATAVAGELNYPFLLITAGRLQSKWINESTDQVARVFREARAIADEHGYAVVIAEELDTLLPRRGGTGQHHEDDKVVTECLAYLERCSENNTLFVGTTNRRDELDPAVVRPGRIDRKYRFRLPPKDTRVAILKEHLEDRPSHIASDELTTIAERTKGASAADLVTIVESAARYAVENSAPEIKPAHLRSALEVTKIKEKRY